MNKIDLLQYKSQFHYVFNNNPGNQGPSYFYALSAIINQAVTATHRMFYYIALCWHCNVPVQNFEL
jgi:hypothetical protein